MDFNKEILNYAIAGISENTPKRYPLAALRTLQEYYDIRTPKAFDAGDRYYRIVIDYENYYMHMSHGLPDNIKVISPEEYISILTGKTYDSKWYDTLEVDSVVTLGWADISSSSNYGFGFEPSYVNNNSGKEVTIAEIREWSSEALLNKKWSNGDTRIYRIKEFNHWLLSSMFIPTFDKTPIKRLNLTSLSINSLSF